MTVSAEIRARVRADLADVTLRWHEIAKRQGVTYQFVSVVNSELRYEDPSAPTGRDRQRQRTMLMAEQLAKLMANPWSNTGLTKAAQTLGISKSHAQHLMRRWRNAQPH